MEKKLNKLGQNKEIIVLSGIRRCGKSVLLEHIRRINGSGNDYYFNFEDERLVNFNCDFVVREGSRTQQVIQVCIELSDPSTKAKEISGLIEAMNKFFLSEGLIITENEESDEIVELKGKKYHIMIKPIWKWLRVFDD